MRNAVMLRRIHVCIRPVNLAAFSELRPLALNESSLRLFRCSFPPPKTPATAERALAQVAGDQKPATAERGLQPRRSLGLTERSDGEGGSRHQAPLNR
jgi:hypothetical protein